MKKNLVTSFWAVGILWVVYFLDLILPGSFNQYGIRPHEIGGLIGILTAPFLHANMSHLVSNSIPLFILTLSLLTFYKEKWLLITIYSIVLGGLAVWLLSFRGEATNHIGASGVIFSYIAFLMASGLFRRTFKSFSVGIIIFFLYGGTLFFGVIPSTPGVSWEGHLYGAIAGILIAWVFRNTNKEEKAVY